MTISKKMCLYSIYHTKIIFTLLALRFCMSHSQSPLISYGDSDLQFCPQALKHQKCFAPNVSELFDISIFMGQWYQIGITGQSKLENEAGSICQQFMYTLVSTNLTTNHSISAFNVVKTRLQILNPISSLGIQTIGKSTKTICYSAKKICELLSSTGEISQTLAQIGYVIAKLALPFAVEAKELELASSHILIEASLIELELDSLAKNISNIQNVVSSISSGFSSTSKVLELRTLIDLACNQISKIMQHLSMMETNCAKIDQIATKLLFVNISILEPQDVPLETSLQLKHASLEILKHVGFILSKTTNIDATLETINAASDLLLFNQNITSSTCSRTGSGYENYTTIGKLEITMDDDVQTCQKTPFWILALDGSPLDGYESALLYSCIEESSGDTSKSIVILSRKATLATKVVEKYTALARAFGIQFDCQDLFIVDEQNASCSNLMN